MSAYACAHATHYHISSALILPYTTIYLASSYLVYEEHIYQYEGTYIEV